MPLIKSGTKAAISKNISEMVHAGHPHDQAVAAAMSTARKYGRQFGGAAPWYTRQEARGIAREGLLSGSSPGRADKLPINVPSGAYVIPADVVSGFGQGNTQSGALALGKMFGTGPLGMPTLKGGAGRGRGPKVSIGHASRIGTSKMPKGAGLGPFAAGGYADGGDADTTPIAASHGEFLVHPKWIIAKYGNLKRGHEVLDEFVKHSRKQFIKQQQKLPGPAKS